MNNRFTLPIALAVAVHAAFLAGFRHGPAVIKVPVKDTKVEKPFVLPPEIEIVEYHSGGEIPKGSPDAARPELESVDRLPSPIDIHMDATPPTVMPRIDPGIIGCDLPGDPVGKGPPGSVFNFASLDNPPTTRVQISPDYPHAAKAAGLDGEVWVEFIVDPSGRVHDPAVVRSSDRMFEEATLRAVSKWRFEPGKLNGRPVSFRMSVPVLFHLSDS
jgi:protein TonB